MLERKKIQCYIEWSFVFVFGMQLDEEADFFYCWSSWFHQNSFIFTLTDCDIDEQFEWIGYQKMLESQNILNVSKCKPTCQIGLVKNELKYINFCHCWKTQCIFIAIRWVKGEFARKLAFVYDVKRQLFALEFCRDIERAIFIFVLGLSMDICRQSFGLLIRSRRYEHGFFSSLTISFESYGYIPSCVVETDVSRTILFLGSYKRWKIINAKKKRNICFREGIRSLLENIHRCLIVVSFKNVLLIQV